jgi:hypothetical protein
MKWNKTMREVNRKKYESKEMKNPEQAKAAPSCQNQKPDIPIACLTQPNPSMHPTQTRKRKPIQRRNSETKISKIAQKQVDEVLNKMTHASPTRATMHKLPSPPVCFDGACKVRMKMTCIATDRFQNAVRIDLSSRYYLPSRYKYEQRVIVKWVGGFRSDVVKSDQQPARTPRPNKRKSKR